MTHNLYKKDIQYKKDTQYKKKKQYKSFYKRFVLAWLTLIIPLSAKEITELKVWSNGIKVEQQIKKMETRKGMQVALDTMGLPKGYYTAFLFKTSKKAISLAKGYEGVKFYLDNPSEEPLQMNLSMENQWGEDFKLEEGMPVIAQNIQGEKQVIKVEYGNILIPPDFKGNVYIPIDFNHMISYGLIITMEEETKRVFNFMPFEWIPKGNANLLEESYVIEIEGEKQVVIPAVGETIIPYKGMISNLFGVEKEDRIKFSLMQEQEGVTLTEEGILKVNNLALAGKVLIKASFLENPSWSSSFEVILDKPLNNDDAYQKMQMPEPLDVSPLTALKPWKFNENNINRIRSVGILSLILVGAFLRWYLKSE